MDITPTELFVRGTGDWNMVKEYSEMAHLLQDLRAKTVDESQRKYRRSFYVHAFHALDSGN